MGRIFMTGLEAGSLNVFDVVSDLGIILKAIDQRTGNYAIAFTTSGGTNGYAGHVLATPVEEIYLRAYIHLRDSVHGDSDVLLIADATGKRHIRFTAGGELYSWNGASWVDLGGLVTGMDIDAYYRWEFYIRISQSDVYPDGQVIIRRDGVEQYNQDNIDTLGSDAGTEPTIGRIYLGNLIGAVDTTGEILIDDIAINDTFGAVNNSWPGKGAIVGLKVTNGGNYSDFTPTPGTGESNWQDVVTVPPNDATYLSSMTAGDKDTFLVEDPAAKGIGPNSIIAAAQWIIRGKLPIAGSSTIYPFYNFRQVVDAQLSAEEFTKTTFEYIRHIEDIDPITHAAWLASNVRDSEFGFVQG